MDQDPGWQIASRKSTESRLKGYWRYVQRVLHSNSLWLPHVEDIVIISSRLYGAYSLDRSLKCFLHSYSKASTQMLGLHKEIQD